MLGNFEFLGHKCENKMTSHKNHTYSFKKKIASIIENGAQNFEFVEKLNCHESTVQNLKKTQRKPKRVLHWLRKL